VLRSLVDDFTGHTPQVLGLMCHAIWRLLAKLMKPGLARFEQKHHETVMNTSLKTSRGGALKINLGLAKSLDHPQISSREGQNIKICGLKKLGFRE